MSNDQLSCEQALELRMGCEGKVARKRIEEREGERERRGEEGKCNNPHPIPPSATSPSASSFLSHGHTLPAGAC